MTYTCGPTLDGCRCRHGRVSVHRTPAEIRAAHRAAVARAKRSGFAREPLPVWLWEQFDPGAVVGLSGRRAA